MPHLLQSILKLNSSSGGNYIARNKAWVRQFLRDWALWNIFFWMAMLLGLLRGSSAQWFQQRGQWGTTLGPLEEVFVVANPCSDPFGGTFERISGS